MLELGPKNMVGEGKGDGRRKNSLSSHPFLAPLDSSKLIDFFDIQQGS